MKSNKYMQFLKETHKLATNIFPAYSSRHSRKDFTLHQLITLEIFRMLLDMPYRDFTELLEVMSPVQELLELSHVPHFTTLNHLHQPDRVDIKNLRMLLLLSARKFDLSGDGAIDATGMDRSHASRHYTKRTKMTISSLKTTVLIDTESLAIMDVHLTTTRKHDTRIGPQLAGRNVDLLDTLSADKGYDDRSFRKRLRDDEVRPLIKHREFKPYQQAANARMDSDLYNKRNRSETAFSILKRKQGSAVRSRIWNRQFREMILKMIGYNLNRLVKRLFFVFFHLVFFQRKNQKFSS